MLAERPQIKDIHPVYSVTPSLVRIGAEPGVTVDVDNNDGLMLTFIGLIDGTRTVRELVESVQQRFPNATEADVIEGLETLTNLGFIEDAAHEPVGLTASDLERYSRNIAYFQHFASPEVSKYIFQKRLKEARVCVFGLGGHGSSLVFQLAALGVGHITAVDSDFLELSNLNRLVTYRAEDVGRSKADLVADGIRQFSPGTSIETFHARVANDAKKYVDGADLVLCAADQPYAQFDRWVNQACILANVPCLYSAHLVTTGRIYSVVPGNTGCIDCMIGNFLRQDQLFERQFWALVEDGAITRAHQGVIVPNLTMLTGMIAMEATRFIAKHEPPLSQGQMLEVQFRTMNMEKFFDWPRLVDCPTCGNGTIGDWSFFERLDQHFADWRVEATGPVVGV